MKKFLMKISIFSICFLMNIIVFIYLSAVNPFRDFIAKVTNSTTYGVGNVGSTEIIPYIQKVQENNSYDKLIIGDSVCHQMYNNLQPYNNEYCIVGSNRAITIAGQYILVREFLEHHQNVKDIYLIIILNTLSSTFDTTYGYQYVVMPFAQTDTLHWLEETTIQQLNDTYGSFFIQKKIVNLIDQSPLNRKLYLNSLKKVKDISMLSDFVSDTTHLYLKKLYTICKERNINLHLLPGPVADNESNHRLEDSLKKDFIEKGLDTYFPDYFSNIEYYSQEQFPDGTHFGGEYGNQEYFNKLIQDLQRKTGLLDNLQFQ